jgi:MFS family permease
VPPSFHEARWRHGLLLLSTAAGIRAFCIGLTGVLLGLYLARRGYTAGQLGVVVGCGLAGNAVATAWLALAAPRVKRRAVLLVSTVLGGAGLIGAVNVSAPLAIAVVGFVGLVNGMGRDRGPAQVLEQSLLSDRLPISDGTRVMVRYTAWFFKRFGLTVEVIGRFFSSPGMTGEPRSTHTIVPGRRKAPPRKSRWSPDLPNGADRDRTGDPLLAKQVLSQLSYRPETCLD